MRVRISVSRTSFSRTTLYLLAVGLCIWLGPAPAGAVEECQIQGNLTVTGNQSVAGGVNVGSATDAGTAQVKMKSSSASPSAAWQVAFVGGSTSLNPCTSVGDTAGWTALPSGALVSNLSAQAESPTRLYDRSPYGTSGVLYTQTYGFSVPADAVVTGVEVSYCIQGGTPAGTAYFQLCAGGSSKSMTMPSSWGAGTLGSSSDLWGATLTPAIVNSSSFGVQTWMYDVPMKPIYYSVDYLRIKVYWATATDSQWMAGAHQTDGTWRLVNSVTDLNTNVKMTMKNTGYLGIGTSSPSYKLDVATDHASGYAAKFFNDGNNVSRRGIMIQCGLDSQTASTNYYIQCNDGDGTDEGALAVVNGTLQIQQGCDAKLKSGIVTSPIRGLEIVKGIPVRRFRFGESGQLQDGFVAQEVEKLYPQAVGEKTVMVPSAGDPATLVADTHKVLYPLMLVPPLYRAVQEQDERIARIETSSAEISQRMLKVSGVDGSGLDLTGTPGDETIQRLTEAVLEKLGVEPWIEIPISEAWEEADETKPVPSKQTVTYYRLKPETRTIEPYTVEETVTIQQPTGNKINQLKQGVRFDEKTGKFYRWCGLGGATPQQTAAALGKIMPMVPHPSLKPVFAATGSKNPCVAASENGVQ